VADWALDESVGVPATFRGRFARELVACAVCEAVAQTVLSRASDKFGLVPFVTNMVISAAERALRMLLTDPDGVAAAPTVSPQLAEAVQATRGFLAAELPNWQEYVGIHHGYV
jgi:hypothetical protein